MSSRFQIQSDIRTLKNLNFCFDISDGVGYKVLIDTEWKKGNLFKVNNKDMKTLKKYKLFVACPVWDTEWSLFSIPAGFKQISGTKKGLNS